MSNTSKTIQVKCIKDVVMEVSKMVAFIKGKTYDATLLSDNRIYAKNEQGENYHWINRGLLDNTSMKSSFFEEHFIVVYEGKSDVSDASDYVKEVLEQKKIDLLNQAKRVKGDIENHKSIVEDLEESLEDIMGKLDAIYKVTG